MMAVEILMPALSPTMEEGTLAKWIVKEGDTVAAGDLLAEIETDKATMEFEAVDEGIIGKILVAEGTAGVKVNIPIAILVEEGEAVPDVSSLSADQEASKHVAATHVPTQTHVQSQQIAGVVTLPTPSDAGTSRVFASPLARRMATHHHLDLHQIKGSGPHGRIIKIDIEAALAAPQAAPSPAASAAPAKTSLPEGPQAAQVLKMYEGREYSEVPLDGMRRTVASRLTEAKQTIPHFYLRRNVQIDTLLSFRSDLNQQLEGRGIKLSVNDFVIKSCAIALQNVPDANAVWAGDRIIKLKPSDVAVAVAVDGGLFTPVLFDADAKTLSNLSSEMKDLASRARDRKLAPHEYVGGSFAISNLGMFGIDNFDAVINPPHGAILAVGTGRKQAVVSSEGELSVATIMALTLSVDHRVIDGALGAQLLQAIVENLENPLSMLA